MRISRKKKKPQQKKRYYYNEKIPVNTVLVLDEEGKRVGEMNTAEAIRQAQENEMDLILINPKSDPAVAKFGDYGQFKYQKEKEERKRKAKAHVTEIKGVRLSMRISDHDLEIRRKQAVKFLNNGDKVKIEIILRGRENKNPKMAFDIIKDFIDSVNEIEPVKLEQDMEKQGNKVTAIIVKK